MEENQGWIKLHRKFLKWEWYDDINTSRFFLHCLFRANHKDKKWRGTMIKRGQFISSLSKLAIGMMNEFELDSKIFCSYKS